MNLNEAFQKLNLLESEDFNISSAMDSADLRNFIDTDELSDEIDIIDVQADTEDDIEDSYVGKVVTECCICHSKFYKDPSEIKIDNESGCCNIDEECPVCFSQDGYKVIGKIVPYEEVEEVTITDEDGDGNLEAEVDTKVDIDECGDKNLIRESKKHLQSCDEGLLGAAAGGLLGGAVGHPIVGALAGNAIQNSLKDTDECLEEDFQSATIETDDQVMSMDSTDSGKVTITTEPKTNEGETMAPIDIEDAIEISDNQEPEEDEIEDTESDVEDQVDVDVDEFDEESFDELGESYLRRVYENVESYKTKNITRKNNKLFVEGIIKFNSGKERGTSFVFESYKVTKSGKMKFIGENTQITKGRKAFTITGNLKDKKFMTESLNYNYRQKDSDGKSVRLYGTVRK